jgi:hypothetical protein
MTFSYFYSISMFNYGLQISWIMFGIGLCQSSKESKIAKYSQIVLLNSLCWVTNKSNPSILDVGNATRVIVDSTIEICNIKIGYATVNKTYLGIRN